MAVINHAKREINAKIVYFGSHGCGKGELLRFIHQRIKPDLCGPLKTTLTGSDTLLFFDYVPFESSSLNGYRVRFHLYTLTGPVTNPGMWKMTLKGVDGLIFVTAVGKTGGEEAMESLRVLRSMLSGYYRDLRDLPRFWLSCDFEPAAGDYREIEVFFDASRTVACSSASGAGLLQSLARLSQDVMQKIRLEIAETATESVTSLNVKQGGGADVSETSQEQIQETIKLPESRLFLSGSTVLRVPVTIQSGTVLKSCNLVISLEIE